VEVTVDPATGALADRPAAEKFWSRESRAGWEPVV